MSSDSIWYSKIRAKTGKTVSGGAALNVRVANAGGMDTLLEETVAVGVRAAVNHALARIRSEEGPSVRRIVRSSGRPGWPNQLQ